MTYYRQQGTPEAVLLDVLHVLSPAVVKQYAGLTTDHLYNVSKPTSRRGFHFETAAHLDAALIVSGLPPRFHPLMEAITSAKVNGKATGVCLDHALRAVVVCAGDMFRELEKAYADGKLDIHERRALAGIAQAGMDLFQQIRDEVEPPCQGPQEVA